MSTLSRRLVALLRRHPAAADAAVSLFFAAAALVSLYTTFELLRQDPKFHEPAKPAIFLALLAGRFRLPGAAASRSPLRSS